ncbi:beta-galactosidase [Acidovorax sp. SUPP950]|uniref:hypothetical protein n=1 Tax=Acidovorax sp. SUPP950 TaxID=511901 RepID=UPI0023D49441|nr:hypothetical protein [Acidovorax sp. SUPP950]GKS75254.1 beta-galactosidase [Acidovorax sp. SUPP950]
MRFFNAHRILAAALSLLGAAAHADTAPRPARAPFIVAPTIVGTMVCDEAASDPRIKTYEAAIDLCRARKRTGAAAINRLLDTLEPGGPRGQVQIGFTSTLQLLALYRRTATGWEIDTARVDEFLQLVADVKRPVVLYLAGDHFDSAGPLTDELEKDPRNLMQLPGGKPLELGYFGYRIAPYTLETDASIPVNRYRYEALRYVARRIKALPAEQQQRIVAITLAGELHHLFPDFEHGMGEYQNIRTTDYSPASVAGFQAYLARQYGSIAALNRQAGTAYAAFNTVPAPSHDVSREPASSLGEHYDAFADGTLPLSGWLWDPAGRVTGLDLYLDARYIGPVARGYNRLDVYRALDEVTTPNVGFRTDVDFSALRPGKHMAQIVARVGGARFEVAQTEFTVMPRDRRVAPPNRRPPEVFGMKAASELPGVRSWLDLPKPQQGVLFNPLARDWNRYREQQVARLLGEFHRIASSEGLPADKLYSHQIVPNVNSSWNPQLFAADQTLHGSLPWKHGINLYGGATDSDWVRGFLAERKIADYGVPEFNPQQWKRDGAHLAAMQSHYAGGARFISPYYFSVIPNRFKGSAENGVNRMELGPDNTKDGSDRFYRAIIEFAKR